MIALFPIILVLLVLDCWIIEKHLKYATREVGPTVLFLSFVANYIPLSMSQIINEWIYAFMNEVNSDLFTFPIFWLNPMWDQMIKAFYYSFSFIYDLFWIFGSISLLGSYSSSKLNDKLISAFLAMGNAMSFLIYQLFSEDKNILILYIAYFTIFVLSWVGQCNSPNSSRLLDLILAWYNFFFLINTLLTIKILFLPNNGTFDILKFICFLGSYLWITFFILIFFLVSYVTLCEHLESLFNEFLQRFKQIHALEKNYLKLLKAYAIFVGFIIEIYFSNNLIGLLIGEEIWLVKEGLFLIWVGAFGNLLMFPDEVNLGNSSFLNVIAVWVQAWLIKRLINILII